MAEYHIGIRRDPYGKYGYTITDGRGSKVSGRSGCSSISRAEHVARGAAGRLIATDRLLGRPSHVATGAIEVSDAYAWRDPHDDLWRVGDRDNAGTHRPGVSRECAEREASAANARDLDGAPDYWGGTDSPEAL